MNVTLRITENTIGPALSKLSLALQNKQPLLSAIGKKFMQMTQENFGPSGRWRPEYWPPLSPRYQKQIKYYGPPKLILKWKLIGSLQMEVHANSVEVSVNTPYAHRHQFGGSPVPARPYFPVVFGGLQWRLSPAAENQIRDVISRELSKAI